MLWYYFHEKHASKSHLPVLLLGMVRSYLHATKKGLTTWSALYKFWSKFHSGGGGITLSSGGGSKTSGSSKAELKMPLISLQAHTFNLIYWRGRHTLNLIYWRMQVESMSSSGWQPCSPETSAFESHFAARMVERGRKECFIFCGNCWYSPLAACDLSSPDRVGFVCLILTLAKSNELEFGSTHSLRSNLN